MEEIPYGECLSALEEFRCEVLASVAFSRRDNPLHAPIGEVIEDSLLVLSSDTPMAAAREQFTRARVELALVQDSPHTIEGVLRREACETALVVDALLPVPTVGRYLDRNICIEPEIATVLEILERMTVGCCPWTVVVDGRRGDPLAVISPRRLLEFLVETFPYLPVKSLPYERLVRPTEREEIPARPAPLLAPSQKELTR